MNEYKYYVAVKFDLLNEKFFYFTNIDDLALGDDVVCDTEKGVRIGRVASKLIPCDGKDLNLEPLVRKATSDDLLINDDNEKRCVEVIEFVKKQIEFLGLNMNPLKAEYSLDATKLLIVYVSEERVDFRELLKILAAKYHCRIELRQINTRDKAKG